jgi:hypothetical protein
VGTLCSSMLILLAIYCSAHHMMIISMIEKRRMRLMSLCCTCYWNPAPNHHPCVLWFRNVDLRIFKWFWYASSIVAATHSSVPAIHYKLVLPHTRPR